MTESLEQEIRKLRSYFWSDRDPSGRGFVPLADAYRRSGNHEGALDVLQEGLARLPDFASGHVVAGWVHRDRGAAEAALTSFRRVLDLDPENLAALRGVGELADAKGDTIEALEHYIRAASLDPDDRKLEERIRALQAEVPGAAASFADASRTPGPGEAASMLPEAAFDAPEAPGGADGAGGEAEPWAAPFDAWDEGTGEAGAPAPEGAGSPVPVTDAYVDPRAEWLDPGPETEAGDEPAPAARGREEEQEPPPRARETPPPETRPEGDGFEDAEEGELYTRTMGELYASQGLHDRAITVYEHLLDADPENPGFRNRLRELRVQAGLEAPGAGAGAAVTDAPDETAAAAPTTDVPGQPEDDPSELAAAELAGSPRPPEVPGTPFAWAEEEPVEAVEATGPPAADYFRALLDWTPGAAPPLDAGLVGGAAAPAEPEAVPIEELAPDPVESVGAIASAPTVVPIEDLAADAPMVVPVEELAPEGPAVVPIEDLAPAGATVVPIQSLAPDPPVDPSSVAGDDDFRSWLDNLKP